MSIIDSIKSVASEGLHLAGSVEKLAENGLGTLVHAGEKALTTAEHLPELALHFTETEAKSAASVLGTSLNTAIDTVSYAWKKTSSLANTVSSFLPGIAEAKTLVTIGENVLKSSTSGDIFKLETTASIASIVPGLGALVGLTAIAKAEKDQTKKKDEIFNYVSTDEWKQILHDKDAAKASASSTEPAKSATQSVDGILPKAHVDEHGVEFERTAYDTTFNKAGDAKPAEVKGSQTKVEGDIATHTEADGTVTTQVGGHTEIDHAGRRIVKDTNAGVVKEYVGDRLAWQQNGDKQTQEWNTRQGLRVVQENGEYKIFNAAGVLIGTRPVSVIASEVQEEDQTLSNGDQMRRHLTGRIMDHLRSSTQRYVANSGKEWDVYNDGVSRTLSTGVTVGLMATSDAFVQTGTTTVVRRAQDKKFYIIEDGKTQEVDVNSAVAAPVKAAIEMLQGIDRDAKMHLGDGAFLTVRDGKVVGGTDEIVDEPVPPPSGANTQVLPLAQKKVEVTMVTTGKDASTSTLLGGFQSTYEWGSHTSTIAEPDHQSDAKGKGKAKPIVVITDQSLTTDDVISTKKGTTDRVTHDFMGADGSIATSNGIKVSANNDIQFADGVKFGHDGKVTLADGRVARSGSSDEAVAQQASSALATAMSVASSVAGKAASGTITFADIALLQASIFDVQSLVGTCMAAGNLEVAQSLMATSSGLESALGSANQSFTANTALRAMRSNIPTSSNQIQAGQFPFLQTKRAA
jgi:hypothetical protein